MQAWTNCVPYDHRAQSGVQNLRGAPGRTFCLVKKKNSFDLQISYHIDETMKKL